MIRVVLDTNVVVSAHLNEQGHEATALDLVFAGELQLFLSTAIFAEYAMTLARPKFRAVNPDRIGETLAILHATAILTEPRHRLSISADEPDNRFLEFAEAANALSLFTGNKRRLSRRHGKPLVLSARGSFSKR